MELRLSKSKYLAGMQCIKRLWLQFYKPDKAVPPSPAQQRIFDQGTAVGELARKSFPGGRLILAAYYETAKALEQTEQALQAGIVDLFEPCFVFANTVVRVDVLHRNADSTYDIVEVKSTTGAHPEHIWDLAIQTFVLEGCGLPVRSTRIMHLDRACRYPDLSNLFTTTDLTQEVRDHLQVVPDNLSQFNTTIYSETEPSNTIGSYCSRPYECPFRAYCFNQADVPTISIFNIPRLGSDKLDSMIASSILSLETVPADLSLSDTQREFIDLYVRGTKRVDIPGIKTMLSGLTYPLYFLDFETDSPAVPWLVGLGPYHKFPFQFSLHILDQGGSLSHTDYLHTEASDPRAPLAEALLSAIGSTGTIVAYNASFEKSVIESLATALPELSYRLRSLTPRFWDLLDIFRKHYIDPAFGGSNSIKAVLPILCPDLSYKDLDVQDGSSAQVAWLELIKTDDCDMRRRLTDQLKAYCYMDTLAMVRIYQQLQSL